MRLSRLYPLFCLMFLASPAMATEISLSLGRNDILDRHGDTSSAIGLGIASGPLTRLGPVRVAVGAGIEAGDKGELWGGAGPILFIPFAEKYRVSASVMAGVYQEGEGVDLGSSTEFRSRLGLSRAIGEDWRLGLAIEHKSNAHIGETNPGIETLFVTVAHSF